MDNSEEKTCALAMQVIVASVLPVTLKSAIELDLLELIKKSGPGAFVSTAELAAQIPATNPDAPVMLDRILRLLAANNILNCSLRSCPDGGVERLYSLAPVCKFFTKNDDGVSLAPLLIMGHDKFFMETWYHLNDAILEGAKPFDRAYGMNGFEYMAMNKGFNKIFNQAMFEQSTIFMKKILETYKGFEGLESLVDVGGGIGAAIKIIVSKYPSIRGINFDLPHVIQDATSYPGMEHIAGDMFDSVPRGDAIFMKWICHDWSDAHCLKLLKNCYEALPNNGKVIIADRILSEIPNKNEGDSTDFAMDIVMLLYNPGGKERTEKEFQALAEASGFKEFRKVCCCFNIWIMEVQK